MNSLFNQNMVVYSLDLSALFAAFNERYPIANFPAFWCKIEELIKSDRLKIAEIAFDEALRDEGVKKWCKENQLRPNFRWATNAPIQRKVSEILKLFPKLLDDRRGKSGDDPWAIALAMVSQNCIVVTEEKPRVVRLDLKSLMSVLILTFSVFNWSNLYKERIGSFSEESGRQLNFRVGSMSDDVTLAPGEFSATRNMLIR